MATVRAGVRRERTIGRGRGSHDVILIRRWEIGGAHDGPAAASDAIGGPAEFG